jgi:hypothetical protein
MFMLSLFVEIVYYHLLSAVVDKQGIIYLLQKISLLNDCPCEIRTPFNDSDIHRMVKQYLEMRKPCKLQMLKEVQDQVADQAEFVFFMDTGSQTFQEASDILGTDFSTYIHQSYGCSARSLSMNRGNQVEAVSTSIYFFFLTSLSFLFK